MSSSLALSSLTATQGFKITGANSGDQAGYSVSTGGDVNGDGYADIVIGAPYTGVNAVGTTYIIFGKAAGFATISLSNLTTSQGFSINGYEYPVAGGFAVDVSGDINGDGYSDILIAQTNTNTIAYVIFGHSGTFANIQLSSLTSSEGITITGSNPSLSNMGHAISWAGDVNNDGYSDIVIGTPGVGSNSGKVYIVLGSSTPSNVILANLTPSIGIKIISTNSGAYVGWSVNAAGDLNKDGYDDILVGAYGASSSRGITYVLYGAEALTNINLTSITKEQGFFITGCTSGDQLGYSVAGTDINNDGYADVILGTPGSFAGTGSTSVIYGSATESNFNGCSWSISKYVTYSGGGKNGYSVSKAGDINGDGFNDIIIGAPTASSNTGISYIVFGSSSSSSISVSSLASSQGFSITGETTGDYSGWSVSGGGDINGDGYADVVIGARGASSSTGAVYVIFGAASGFVTPSPTRAPTVPPTVAPTSTIEHDLVAYYPFNGNANDATGNGNDGSVNNAVLTTDRYGNADSAYHFDGSTSYIEVEDGIQFNFINSFSISLWIKPTENQGSVVRIIDKSHGALGSSAWSIEGSQGSQNYYYFVYRQNITDTWGGFASAQLLSNRWNHYVSIKQNTNLKIFLNGALISTVNGTSAIIKTNGNLPLNIGRDTYGGTYFNGTLDDIRIYKRALTTSEVQQLYMDGDKTSSLQTGLVAYYPFSGNANDKSGNGYNGVVHHATLTTDRFGNSNSAYHFDGSSSYIEILNGTAFNFANSMSISVWIRPTSIQTDFAGIIEKGTYNAQAGFIIQQYVAMTNAFYFAYIYASATGGTSSATQSVANKWNHLVFTKQNAKVNCYLNGILISTQNNLGSTILSNGNIPVLIGAENSAVTSPASLVTRYFNGSIDDIFIYNRSLAASEVAELYTLVPSLFTWTPTSAPTYSFSPTTKPSVAPTYRPTRSPTAKPTHSPTKHAIIASNIDLASFSSTKGITINGPTSTTDQSGYSVSSAGDINGDGYSDIIIGSSAGSGNTYVIYGGASLPSTINLNSANTACFYIAPVGGGSGFSVSSAGDVNGDGYDDIVIGMPYGISSAGASYIIFGNKTHSNIILGSITTSSGTLSSSSIGISILGATSGDHSGWSVSKAGDVNGDDYPDVIIGAFGAGYSYVIYGNSSLSNINLASISSASGFTIQTNSGSNDFAHAVAGGDINGDGYSDLINGAIEAYATEGATYVVFGKSSLISFVLNDLTHPGQMQIFVGSSSGDNSGFSVASAGDINADGYDDIIIGAPNHNSATGVVYVILGQSSYTSDISLSGITTTQGFTITGAVVGDQCGYSVSGAGDVNNDGYDDIIIGAPYHTPLSRSSAGTVYIIFGKATNTDISLASIDLDQGFSVYGASASNYLGISVSGAGDINNDSYDDIIIGANGVNSDAGATYVIYGNSYSTTSAPTSQPTGQPSRQPSRQPTRQPTSQPSVQPSVQPTKQPTSQPSIQPTSQPTSQPTQPTAQPSKQPSNQPTNQPTGQPSAQPSQNPSFQAENANINLVANPGAETGTMSSWIAINTGSWSSEWGVDGYGLPLSHSGKYSFVTLSTSTVSMMQSLSLEIGTTYEASFWAECCSTATCYLALTVGNKTLISLSSISGVLNLGEYTKYTTSFTASSITEVLKFSGSKSSSSSGGSFITLDDILVSTVSTLNLVANYGAETCDMTYWTDSGTYNTNGWSATNYGEYIHSGFCAFLTEGTAAIIAQSLSLTAYATYTASFWVIAPFGGTNSIDLSIGSNTLISLTSIPSSYTQYSSNFILSSTTKTLEISGSTTNVIVTDDISVTVMPNLINNGGVETADMTSWSASGTSDLNGWVAYCGTDGSPHSGSCEFLTQSSVSVSLNQSLSLIAGGYYTASFYAKYANLASSYSLSLSMSDNIIISTSLSASYTKYSGVFVATSNTETFQIIGKGAIFLDDIVVISISTPTGQPTGQPSTQPSKQPTEQPTAQPTGQPSSQPSVQPTMQPSTQPTVQPTSQPSIQPSCYPSVQPTDQPSNQPSVQPTAQPSSQPSVNPSAQPTICPSTQPSLIPSSQPSSQPTIRPTSKPTAQPSVQPSSQPSSQPTCSPSIQPSGQPTAQPSRQPSLQPTMQPSIRPSAKPSAQPTVQPASQPTEQPSRQPSGQPTAQPTNPTGQPTASPSILAKELFGGIDLLKLTSYIGIPINGKTSYDYSGFSVSSAGDVNKDGFSDVIVGAPNSSPNSRSNAGSAFIVTGSYSPSKTNLAATLSNVIQIYGANAADQCGIVVNKAGDFNKDTYDDVMISCYYASPNSQTNAGAVYIIYGSTNTSRTVDLSAINSLQGFYIYGANTYDSFGFSIAYAGDLNNDGYADIAIGAPIASPNSKTNAGIVYIVYGNNNQGNIDLFLGTNTAAVYSIYGASAADYFGYSIGNGLDINNDGYADLIIGASQASDNAKINSGTTYILFGKFGTSSYILSDLNSTYGIKIYGADTGDYSGYSVGFVKDYNNDNKIGLLIGAPYRTSNSRSAAGTVYVLYGLNYTSNYDLANVTSNIGIKIYGAQTNQNLGMVVSYAGDINDDGFGDIILGSSLLSYSSRNKCGKAYVIYGSSSPANQDLLYLTIDYGFNVIGANSLDYAGVSVNSAGDVNNDGYTDIIIGAYGASPNSKTKAGISYIIYGGYNSPTSQPTGQPSVQPSRQPTSQPTLQPTSQPTSQPSAQPSAQPIGVPTAQPSGQPSSKPTAQPSKHPSSKPSTQPSAHPSVQPSGQPSSYPSAQPSKHPSSKPSSQPSEQPTAQPSEQPTTKPTAQPFAHPTSQPTAQPIAYPTSLPTAQPTSEPSSHISKRPTPKPVHKPTSQPTGQPTTQPTAQPNLAPTSKPSAQPSSHPSRKPTSQPSSHPTIQPTMQPTGQPTNRPSAQPIASPTGQPTKHPSSYPSGQPTLAPTSPTSQPTSVPTSLPSTQPSGVPSSQPTVQPTRKPSNQPTVQPSKQPTTQPSSKPTDQPTTQPSSRPTKQPSSQPTKQPSNQPSSRPTSQPSSMPTNPTGQPTSVPTILEKEITQGIDLLTLAHYQGIYINGKTAYDNSGTSVAYAGDIDNDGFDDILIGAPQASPLSRTNAGTVFIVYGSYGSAIPNAIDFTLGNYRSAQIYGASAQDKCGLIVTKANDINKDGYADFLISCYLASPNSQTNAGTVYLIFGGNSINTIDLLELNSNSKLGIAIYGANSYEKFGYALAVARDVNQDGYNDLIISSPQATPKARTNAGIVYIIYGNSTLSNIDLSSSSQLSKVTQIYGANAGDLLGSAVDGAIDVNNDNKSDIIIGAAYASENNRISSGSTYIIFGFTTIRTMDLNAFNTTQGFKIIGAGSGDSSGYSVRFLKDFNHDGKTDILVAAPFASPLGRGKAGIVYILYGLDFINDYDLNALNKTIGIKIIGASASDNLGKIVNAGGDANNDGCSDIVIGLPTSSYLSRNKCGKSFVIYGNLVPSDLDISEFGLSRGVPIYGARSIDTSGTSVDLNGDFNGDGFADAIIGAPSASAASKTKSGSAYLVYGGYGAPTSQPTGQPTAQPVLIPTSIPTVQPNAAPTSIPSSQPTSHPTSENKNTGSSSSKKSSNILKIFGISGAGVIAVAAFVVQCVAPKLAEEVLKRVWEWFKKTCFKKSKIHNEEAHNNKRNEKNKQNDQKSDQNDQSTDRSEIKDNSEEKDNKSHTSKDHASKERGSKVRKILPDYGHSKSAAIAIPTRTADEELYIEVQRLQNIVQPQPVSTSRHSGELSSSSSYINGSYVESRNVTEAEEASANNEDNENGENDENYGNDVEFGNLTSFEQNTSVVEVVIDDFIASDALQGSFWLNNENELNQLPNHNNNAQDNHHLDLGDNSSQEDGSNDKASQPSGSASEIEYDEIHYYNNIESGVNGEVDVYDENN